MALGALMALTILWGLPEQHGVWDALFREERVGWHYFPPCYQHKETSEINTVAPSGGGCCLHQTPSPLCLGSAYLLGMVWLWASVAGLSPRRPAREHPCTKSNDHRVLRSITYSTGGTRTRLYFFFSPLESEFFLWLLVCFFISFSLFWGIRLPSSANLSFSLESGSQFFDCLSGFFLVLFF